MCENVVTLIITMAIVSFVGNFQHHRLELNILKIKIFVNEESSLILVSEIPYTRQKTPQWDDLINVPELLYLV